MIDYTKLKTAHELCEKLLAQDGSTMTICICHTPLGYRYIVTDGRLQQQGFDGIDGVITKLKELTQSEPKYKVGQSVWAIAGGQPTEYIYDDKIKDFDLYPTKAALIEAQIEYWQSQREPQTAGFAVTPDKLKSLLREECEHDFRGNVCIKCNMHYWQYSDESVAKNNFTKQELEYLYRKFMLTNGDDFEHALEAKLQGMIDGYCEHETHHQKKEIE